MNNFEQTTSEAQDDILILEPTQPVEENCDEEKAIATVEAAELMILQSLETYDETLNEKLEANSSEDEQNNDYSLIFSPIRIVDNVENCLVN